MLKGELSTSLTRSHLRTRPHHRQAALQDQPRKPCRCMQGRHHELTNASSLAELTWLLSIFHVFRLTRPRPKA